MHILILILVLVLVMSLLPVLFPLIALVTVFLVLSRAMNRLNSRRPSEDEQFRERRINDFESDDAKTLRDSGDVPEVTEIAPKRPSSVRDDAFWQKDHTVYDVPFEETEHKDSEQ